MEKSSIVHLTEEAVFLGDHAALLQCYSSAQENASLGNSNTDQCTKRRRRKRQKTSDIVNGRFHAANARHSLYETHFTKVHQTFRLWLQNEAKNSQQPDKRLSQRSQQHLKALPDQEEAAEIVTLKNPSKGLQNRLELSVSEVQPEFSPLLDGPQIACHNRREGLNHTNKQHSVQSREDEFDSPRILQRGIEAESRHPKEEQYSQDLDYSKENQKSESILQTLTQDDQKWDLVKLSHMRSVLKPRFRYENDEEDCPLFDTVICNENEFPNQAMAHDRIVQIPGRSSFLMADMSKFSLLLQGDLRDGFDCILIDPPWENKSVSRGQQYGTLYAKQLFQLPVEALLSKTGGLVVLWMTNREKLHRFVESELLGKWGLKIIGHWFWQKINKSGQPVSSIASAHRRAYEPLILAARDGCSIPGSLPRLLSIFSVPRQHSRKPCLDALLRKYLGQKIRPCELFARELHTGWTSAGDEVLLFQQV